MRRICKHCREEYSPDPKDLPSDFKAERGQKFYRGVGCRDCRNSGYRGRIGIYELLHITDELREMIIHRKSATELQDVARKRGLKLMRDDGWVKVGKGVTTVEEVVRVTKVNVAALS